MSNDILRAISNIINKINHVQPKEVNSLYEMLSLFLYATVKTDEKINVLTAILHNDWIIRHYSRTFGNPYGVNQSMTVFTQYAKVEIEVFFKL